MARFLLLSDLHFEMTRDKIALGQEVLGQVRATNPDAVVLAGDSTDARSFPWFRDCVLHHLTKLCPVLYVAGNHEYYHGSGRSVDLALAATEEQYANFFWLNGNVVEIAGTRIGGCTLWFQDSPDAQQYKHYLNDFRCIADFEPWVFEQNKADMAFVQEQCGRKSVDLLITHHLPSRLSVDPEFAGSPTNCFFVCDMSEWIRDHGPAVWMHGHTHKARDYVLGKTRIVCNPRGYGDQRETNGFRPGLIVEV